MKKKTVMKIALATTLFGSVLAGCAAKEEKAQPAAANKGEAAKQITIKLAHVGSETHQYQIASEAFKKSIEQKSQGSITVKIYPNAKLGSEKDALEGVQNGTIDMTTLAADSALANIIPEMNLFGIPFLFKDRDHVYRVLDGEIGKSLLAKAESKGIKGLGYWEVGFRNMTTKNKPIMKPEDLAGLKMRVQPAPVWQEFMKALGANPTPVNFNELYSALEQGVVDGQENPIASIMSTKLYDVQKQVALTEHTYTPAAVLVSNKLYGTLSSDQKKWMEEAVQEAAKEQRKVLADAEAKSLEELKGKGVNITKPDRQAFADATKNVAKSLADKVPQELLDQIKAAAK